MFIYIGYWTLNIYYYAYYLRVASCNLNTYYVSYCRMGEVTETVKRTLTQFLLVKYDTVSGAIVLLNLIT